MSGLRRNGKRVERRTNSAASRARHPSQAFLGGKNPGRMAWELIRPRNVHLRCPACPVVRFAPYQPLLPFREGGFAVKIGPWAREFVPRS